MIFLKRLRIFMMKLKNTIVIKKMCVLYYGCKRMGGGGHVELGVSNFLLWQIAYAELHMSPQPLHFSKFTIWIASPQPLHFSKFLLLALLFFQRYHQRHFIGCRFTRDQCILVIKYIIKKENGAYLMFVIQSLKTMTVFSRKMDCVDLFYGCTKYMF